MTEHNILLHVPIIPAPIGGYCWSMGGTKADVKKSSVRDMTERATRFALHAIRVSSGGSDILIGCLGNFSAIILLYS
jgi:hypothetical protein